MRSVCLYMLFAAVLAACATPPSRPVPGPGPVTPGPVSQGLIGPTAMPPALAFVPDEAFYLCDGLRVSNAPASDRYGRVVRYARLVVHDDRLALAPVPINGGCLSSGVGPRNGRLHKALDISAPQGTWVYAGAPGIVLEAGWGGGYGYYVLVDHGHDLFTRYAHLSSFAEGMRVGLPVSFGTPLGQVGMTSSQRITGPHLHYEVLVGDYGTPRRSFALKPVDPFTFPPYLPPPETGAGTSGGS